LAAGLTREEMVDKYEEIVRNIRSRTTAEVLMQRDHVTKWPPENPDTQQDKGFWWDHMMNNVFLPDIAKKYGAGLADVRGEWLAYLKANRLEPKALLSDDVHLNDHGNFLMSELIKPYLIHRPDLPKTSWSDMVRTLEVGKDVNWKDGKLTLELEGNRVDALSAWTGAGAAGKASVRIDGKKPSEFPGAYAITRPTPGPWSPLALTRVDHESPLLVEDWTMTITSVSDDGKRWEYEVAGSKTGPDGSGSNAAPFTSKSGRVKVLPDYFFNRFGGGKPDVGYKIQWKVVPMHADTVSPPKVEDAAREYPVTLAQGIPNAKHTLEIVAENGKSVPIRAIRVYQPPVK
ncbi:MAG: SGNH/GDSL hydrolase family protein, partial [Armatimonadetes bacterium]|nr:SGNH/GDSL hydrolase family protein [Armatimonadota bacterium]